MRKNTPSWKPIDYQEFKAKKPTTKIDPRIDWFISSLLANYKQYELDESAKSQLIFFVYLLLNVDFQPFLLRLRKLLSIPEHGFIKASEFQAWQTTFNQSGYNFKTQNPIDKRFNKVLQFLELKMGRLIRQPKSKSMIENPDEELLHVLVKELQIDRPFYFQWLLFLQSVLFLPNPQQFLNNLSHQTQEESISFEQYKISIVLTKKSTLNSIKATLDKNKADIRKTIQGIKTRTKETALEVQYLDRDYSAYKFYIGQNATQLDSYMNKRKEDRVLDEIELPSKKYPGEDYDYGSIRKIASRMKKRIESTFSDKRSIFNAVIDEIEHASLTPNRT